MVALTLIYIPSYVPFFSERLKLSSANISLQISFMHCPRPNSCFNTKFALNSMLNEIPQRKRYRVVANGSPSVHTKSESNFTSLFEAACGESTRVLFGKLVVEKYSMQSFNFKNDIRNASLNATGVRGRHVLAVVVSSVGNVMRILTVLRPSFVKFGEMRDPTLC